MKITGIYKFQNNINGKSYIGQSIDIMKRFSEHRRNSLNPNYPGYDSKAYRAFRKHGFENFSFEVLEQCSREMLGEREIFWIKEYNSYYEGYNSTFGGEDNPSNNPEIVFKRTQKLLNDKEINAKLSHKGESNPNAKLTVEDVKIIRKMYQEGKSFQETYDLFRDKIGRSGFQYCWLGKSWKNILPEVFLVRERVNAGGSNQTVETIFLIRKRLMDGEDKKLLREEYGYSYESFRRIIKLERWTHPQSIPEGYDPRMF